MSPNGLITSNWSEHLEFKQYDISANHLRTFSQPYQNAQMDRQELLKMYEDMPAGSGVVIGGGPGGGNGPPPVQQLLENMRLPDTWPAVDKIHADTQNRLWVAAFTENTYERKWFLFTESGDLSGTFLWPSTRRVVHADQNTVYVRDRKANDLDKVIRYRFTNSVQNDSEFRK